MKPLFWVGLIVLVLGVASLFMGLPRQETHGVEVGDAEIGVRTKTTQRVSPIISAVMIIGGAGMMIASRGRAA